MTPCSGPLMGITPGTHGETPRCALWGCISLSWQITMLSTHSYTDFTRRASVFKPELAPAAYVENRGTNWRVISMYGLMLRFFGLIG